MAKCWTCGGPNVGKSGYCSNACYSNRDAVVAGNAELWNLQATDAYMATSLEWFMEVLWATPGIAPIRGSW
jgi:hypothetical protein